MKQKLIGILYCILQAIAGILLLVNPVDFTFGIFIALGVFLVIMGIVSIIKYFKTPVAEAVKSQPLTKGLLTTLVGMFCMFGADWLIATFPIITILYGVIMLVIGVSKIQLVLDAVRRKENWFWHLISAAITLVCAGIVIMNPFSSTAALWMFTGISLIVDAIFDLIALSFAQKSDKEAAGREKTVESKVVDADDSELEVVE